jgi:acyl carrier protein
MSKIDFEEFSRQFKKELAVQYDGFQTAQLKDIEEYDSMGKIRASMLIEDLFGLEVPLEVLNSAKDLQSLWDYCVQASSAAGHGANLG